MLAAGIVLLPLTATNGTAQEGAKREGAARVSPTGRTAANLKQA
jgi:hypothetical protein